MTGVRGRERELAALRRELGRGRPSLVVVLGRRRAGKSRLIVEATRGVPVVYYRASKIAAGISVAQFRAEVERVAGGSADLTGLDSWSDLLAYLGPIARDRLPGLTVVLDGFPELCQVDPGLPAVVQRAWFVLREGGIPLNLILSGSTVSFMESLVVDGGPLCGRQTQVLDLAPLPYREAAQFFPTWSREDRLRAYGVFGGIPHHLGMCDPDATLAENVRDLVLSAGAPLAEEPGQLLHAELRDVTRYATILHSLADGATNTSDILGRVPDLRDASALSPYLRKLEELRLIRIVRSLDATARERDRRYYLDDPFLAFWYRFILPNASRLHSGHADEVLKRVIAPEFDRYMDGIFQRVCLDYLRLYSREVLPTPVRESGKIWGRGYDMGVAGRLLDGRSLAGECEWGRARMGAVAVDRLRSRMALSRYYGGDDETEGFLLFFSRSGFTADLLAERDADARVRLLGPAELLLG